MRSIVCNPTKSVWNHHEVMYVINPKGDTSAVMPYTLRVITYALRRLHTNPSDWIKNKTVRRLSYFLEAPPGFEPGHKGFADLNTKAYFPFIGAVSKGQCFAFGSNLGVMF